MSKYTLALFGTGGAIEKAQQALLFMLLALLAAVLWGILLPGKVSAAVRTWDGGGTTNNWSDCANWSSDSCPVAGDDVIFNATSSKNAVIDVAAAPVIRHLTIAVDYTGIITQQRDITLASNGNFSQSGGIYSAGSHSLYISGSFVLSGGHFTAPSSNLTIHNAVTIGDGSYFSHNNGVMTLLQFSGSRSTLNCGGAVFNLVVIDGVKQVNSSCTLPLGHNPVIYTVSQSWPAFYLNGGKLTGTGLLTVGALGTSQGLEIMAGGGAVEGFSAIDTGRLVVNGANFDASHIPKIQTRSRVTLTNNATLSAPELLVIQGQSAFQLNDTSTFVHNNGTVVFEGEASSITGGPTFYNLTKTTTVSSILRFVAGSTTTVLGTLTLQGSPTDLLLLESSEEGSQWNLNLLSSANICYVGVTDSISVGKSITVYRGDSYSANPGWQFSQATCGGDKPGGGGNSGGGELPPPEAIANFTEVQAATFSAIRGQQMTPSVPALPRIPGTPSRLNELLEDLPESRRAIVVLGQAALLSAGSVVLVGSVWWLIASRRHGP